MAQAVWSSETVFTKPGKADSLSVSQSGREDSAYRSRGLAESEEGLSVSEGVFTNP